MNLADSLWQEILDDAFGAFEEALEEGTVSIDGEAFVGLPGWAEEVLAREAEKRGVDLQTVLLNLANERHTFH